MKKVIYIYLFMLLISIKTLCLSQERLTIDTVKVEFVFEYTFQQDSLTKSSLTSLLMILQIGNRYSRFTEENTLLKDSIIDVNKNANEQHIINQLIPLIISHPGNMLAEYSIYKNYPSKGDIEMTSYLSNEAIYRVIQTFKPEWSIKNSTDTIIMGYHCKKATTLFAGRNYSAWFTLDIPISDGPYKFYGLPGLIMYIADDQKQHCFELTCIQKKGYTKPIYYNVQSYINITPKKYIPLLVQDRNRRLQLLSNMQALTEENRARAIRNTLIKNNFIERY